MTDRYNQIIKKHLVYQNELDHCANPYTEQNIADWDEDSIAHRDNEDEVQGKLTKQRHPSVFDFRAFPRWSLSAS